MTDKIIHKFSIKSSSSDFVTKVDHLAIINL